MRLNKLTLRNFKGIQHFVLDAQGSDLDVFGQNATGKTTLFDAFTWLLFDKDSQGRKDFEVKTLDESGRPIHGLEHEVEAVLEIGNRQVTLRKVYREKWTKKRGSAQKVFTGHTTEYYIDNVPVKKAEYESFVAETCRENIFKLLTNPTYFNEQLHWQKRREILLDVCGDISDAEVIQSNPDLAKLPEILGDRSIEDHRKVITAERTRINKELEKIPIRIDEVTQGLPEISKTSRDVLKSQLAELREKRRALAEEYARLEAGGEAAEKRRQLAEIEAELAEIERRHREQIEQQIQHKKQRLFELGEQINALRLELDNKRRAVEANKTQIDRLHPKLDQLREQWHLVNAEVFNQDTHCPTCGQALPAERLEAAQAEFNQQKAARLQEISEEGKSIKAEVDSLKQENKELLAEIEEQNKELAHLEQRYVELEREIQKISQISSPKPEYAVKQKQKQQLEQEIAQIHNNNAAIVERTKNELLNLDHKIASVQTSLAQLEQHERGKQRIEELKAEERRLAAVLEDLEQQLYLTEQFIRTKVQLLENRINNKFELTRFKLFDIQINGAVVECCETTYRGVPYSSLNRGARINVGLDIIRTLSKHYGFSAPIWIDNAEAVTHLIEMNSQVIRLLVSEQDEKLRVELKEPEKQKEVI